MDPRVALFRSSPLLVIAVIISSTIPFSSNWSRPSYSVTVPHSPDEVAEALSNLHLDPDVGSADVDGHRTVDGYAWTVSHDGKPMINYIAHIEALDGGRSTRVTPEVQQLPAATEDGSPKSFKEKGFASGLFNVALEEDLNHLQPDSDRLTEDQAQLRRENETVSLASEYTSTHA